METYAALHPFQCQNYRELAERSPPVLEGDTLKITVFKLTPYIQDQLGNYKRMIDRVGRRKYESDNCKQITINKKDGLYTIGWDRGLRGRLLHGYASYERLNLLSTVLIDNERDPRYLEIDLPYGVILHFRNGDDFLTFHFRMNKTNLTNLTEFLNIDASDPTKNKLCDLYWIRHCLSCSNIAPVSTFTTYKYGDDPFCSSVGLSTTKFMAKKHSRILQQLDFIGCSLLTRSMETAINLAEDIEKPVTLVPFIQERQNLADTQYSQNLISKDYQERMRFLNNFYGKEYLYNGQFEAINNRLARDQSPPCYSHFLRTVLPKILEIGDSTSTPSVSHPIQGSIHPPTIGLVSHGDFIRKDVLLSLYHLENTNFFHTEYFSLDVPIGKCYYVKCQSDVLLTRDCGTIYRDWQDFLKAIPTKPKDASSKQSQTTSSPSDDESDEELDDESELKFDPSLVGKTTVYREPTEEDDEPAE